MDAASLDQADAYRRSPARWFRTPAARLGVIGGSLLTVALVLAALAPLVAPYDPSLQVGPPFSPPTARNPLGTNDVGQDILSELIWGTRVSLLIGFVAALVATVVGAAVGVTAGSSGPLVDAVLMRFVDTMLVLPFLPMMIVLAVFLGQGLGTEILVISLVMWARPARVIRSQVLSVIERGFTQAARSMGGNGLHVARTHILPTIVPLLIAQFVRAANIAILMEAALSFLGLGDPLHKSWGTMLYYAQARGAFLTPAWLWWVLPAGICISGVVLSFAFLGFAIEQRADPRLIRLYRGPTALLGVPATSLDVLDHDVPAQASVS